MLPSKGVLLRNYSKGIVEKINNLKLNRGSKVILIILVVLIIDQFLKIWVKLNMEYGSEFAIFGLEWAKIHFVENNGMAFGMSIGGSFGKLILSVFRIIAVSALGYYLFILVKGKESIKLLGSFALILAGAIGNIIDSVFYGIIFSSSSYHGGYASLFPENGGYSSFLHGKVVDMLYFPIINGKIPSWFPFWQNENFYFFKPVFNIADTAITLGVIGIILFSKHFLPTKSKAKVEEVVPEVTEET